jgi:hypothetical protein
MNNLQEILDDFSQSKLGKAKPQYISNFINFQKGFDKSQEEVICPNCFTRGSRSSMMKFHFDRCHRTQGYSNETMIKRYQEGISLLNISREANVTKSTVERIIGIYKKNITS